jgi:type II secretory pathway component PulF
MTIMKSVDVTEFYNQLALLLKSNLPLPESLTQLGLDCQSKGLQEPLRQMSRATSEGIPLHRTMTQYPDAFSSFHIDLIRAGEESGTLPEVLLEVARFSRNNQTLLARVKEIMLYPFVTIIVCLLIFTLILRTVIPEFEILYLEIVAHGSRESAYYGTVQALDLNSTILFNLSHAVNACGNVIFLFLGIFAAGIAFIFSGLTKMDRGLYRFMARMPGIGRVIHFSDWARITGLLHVYLKRKVPMAEALDQTAALGENPDLQETLRNWALQIRQGNTLRKLLTNDPTGAQPLFCLCLRHGSEETLPDELNELSKVYTEQAEAAKTRAMVYWHAILVVLMTGCVGWVAASLFKMLTFMLEGVF